MITTVNEITLTAKNGDARSFKVELNSDCESEQCIKEYLNLGQLYEREISAIFHAALRPGDTVIDVGANVGWFSLLAATLVGPEGHVIAFEPSHDNVEKLRRNAALNGFTNITVNEAALSDETGTAEFYLNPYGNGGHALWDMQAGRADRKPSTPVTVSKTTLDDWCAQHLHNPPRLIKIDTEGHDKRVLIGAKQLLDKYRPPYIVSELHRKGLNAFGDSQLDFMALMKSYGYDTFLLTDNFPLPVMLPASTVLHSNYTQNLLFSTLVNVGALCPALEISHAEPTA